MAKTAKAITFIFEADQMMRICKGKKKIVVTSYIEVVKTQGGQEVGALRVKARGAGRASATMAKASITSGGEIYGCPQPPCA